MEDVDAVDDEFEHEFDQFDQFDEQDEQQHEQDIESDGAAQKGLFAVVEMESKHSLSQSQFSSHVHAAAAAGVATVSEKDAESGLQFLLLCYCWFVCP